MDPSEATAIERSGEFDYRAAARLIRRETNRYRTRKRRAIRIAAPCCLVAAVALIIALAAEVDTPDTAEKPMPVADSRHGAGVADRVRDAESWVSVESTEKLASNDPAHVWSAIRDHVHAGEDPNLETLLAALHRSLDLADEISPDHPQGRDHERVIEWSLLALRLAKRRGAEVPAGELAEGLVGHRCTRLRREAVRYLAADEAYVPDAHTREQLASDPTLQGYGAVSTLLSR